METQTYLIRSTSLPDTSVGPLRCVWLPEYSEAKVLLEKFIQDIEHMHHILHVPSLPSILDEIYDSLNQQGEVKSGSIILLLAIFASSTYSWMHRDCDRLLFSTSTEAKNQAPLWLTAVEDVLDISYRRARVSIEGIQGIIIASKVLINERCRRRSEVLVNIAYMLARELELHLLDHPSNAHLAKSVKTQIGRRVWWHLVSSDW